jgi:hypothetical protein
VATDRLEGIGDRERADKFQPVGLGDDGEGLGIARVRQLGVLLEEPLHTRWCTDRQQPSWRVGDVLEAVRRAPWPEDERPRRRPQQVEQPQPGRSDEVSRSGEIFG